MSSVQKAPSLQEGMCSIDGFVKDVTMQKRSNLMDFLIVVIPLYQKAVKKKQHYSRDIYK
jgi:hypothetical protein